MAFVAYVQTPEEEQKKKEQGQGFTSETVLSQGQTASPATGSGVGPAATSTPRPKTWTNAQSYLKANEGNTYVADKVTSALDTLANEAVGAGTKYQQEQNKAIESGTAKPLERLDIARLGTKEYADEFNKKLNATYQGPREFGSADLAGQYKKADDQIKAIGSQEGRKAVIGQYAGDERSTGGERSLDAFLFGQGGGQQKIQDLQKRHEGIGSGYSDLMAGLQGKRDAGIEASERAREIALGQLAGAKAQTGGQLEWAKGQVTSRNTQEQDRFAKAQAALDAGNFSVAGNLLGISGDALQQAVKEGMGLSDLGISARNYASSDFLSPEQQAQIQALQSFLGQDAIDFGQSSGGGQVDYSKVNELLGRKSAADQAAEAARKADEEASANYYDKTLKEAQARDSAKKERKQAQQDLQRRALEDLQRRQDNQKKEWEEREAIIAAEAEGIPLETRVQATPVGKRGKDLDEEIIEYMDPIQARNTPVGKRVRDLEEEIIESFSIKNIAPRYY